MHDLPGKDESMQPDFIQHILSSVELPLNDPRFYPKVFTAVCKERKAAQARDGDNLKRVCAEEYDELSRRLDATRIQESCSVRNVLRTRRLANLLVNDKGEINVSLLPRVIAHLSKSLYSLGPLRQYDSKRNEHILKVLHLLRDSKDLTQQLRLISKPHSHPLADQMIRDTLQLPSSVAITDAHARRASLAAWMCYLRQNIGSCFATAPAIIVHDEQPDQFLIDIKEVLNTGRIKRTFAGVEYSVPLSVSWGAGDLRKPLVLSIYDSPEREVWNAPGLIAAFEAAGLYELEAATKDKIKQTKELFLAAYPELNERHPYILTNTEEIIQRVLRQQAGITVQELQDYDNRPKGMVHSGLMMHVSATGSGMGGKGEACSHYYYLFEHATSAFKALSENALLKAWEYTVASFSETKSEFTRWNLYASLGVRPEEPHGIGQNLHTLISHRLEILNKKVSDLQFEYEHMFALLKQLEVHARHSEKDSQWLRADYQSKLGEFHALEDLRNTEHAKAELFANLYNILIERYDKLFPQYFQEVYDADLHEVETGPFDDSPAGFRLIYKHGRASTALWTKIRTPTEFGDALSSFFVATEPEIISTGPLEAIHEDVSSIITNLVTFVKTKEFLESSLQRMSKVHNTPIIADPLEHLEKVSVKPWAYVSGGTMQTLLSCYYRREQKPTEIARWVENSMELLVFLIDTVKQIPYTIMESYTKNPDKSLLMYSPTHAFLLKPGFSPFKEAWQTEAFTYTWVRDYLVKPMERFVDSLTLDDAMVNFLIEYLREKVPDNYRHYFQRVFANLHGPMSSCDFREHLLDRIQHERGLQSHGRGVLSSDDIDSTLYLLLPLFSAHELEKRVKDVLERIPELKVETRNTLLNVLEELTGHLSGNTILHAQNLQDICNALLCVGMESTSLSFDALQAVSKAMQRLGYAMPAPIIFADTNWVKDYFAFLVSPGTATLQLWRVDVTGRLGTPMSIWDEWVNGRRKDRMWGVMTRPGENTPGVIFSPQQPLFFRQ